MNLKKISALFIALSMSASLIPMSVSAAELELSDIVELKYDDGDSITGNNFFVDDTPKFVVTFKNTSGEDITNAKLSYKTSTKAGTEIETAVVDTVSIVADGTIEKTIAPKITHYGLMNLDVILTVGDDKYVETIPYSMSNRGKDTPVNSKFGISAHLGKRYGDFDTSLELINRAGIGALRDELVTWSSVEQEKENIVFSNEHNYRLNALDKYDLFYIHAWLHGNRAVYPEGDGEDTGSNSYLFPVSSDNLDALSNFMYNFAKFANGRVDVLEVWNEFNNNSGIYNKDYDKEVAYHNTVCDAISIAKEDGCKPIEVSGFNGDTYGYYNSPTEITTLLGGLDYQLDAISLHPYNFTNESNEDRNTAPENKSYTTDFPNGVKSALESNGQNKNMPIYFSETGYSAFSFDGDNAKQAAYNIRNQAKIASEGIAKISCINTLFDDEESVEKDSYEASFGMLESYQDGVTEVPYLAKEGYVATAYYNNLMADAKSFANISATTGSNTFCYKINDRDDRNILMVGTVNDASSKLYLNVGTDTVTVADMYGNENIVYTPNGNLELNISGEPLYVIADHMDQVQKISAFTPDTSTFCAVVEGQSSPAKAVVLNVYNEDDSVFYTEQLETNANGGFTFKFPVKAETATLTAVVNCGDGDLRNYVIKSGEKYAVSYEVIPNNSERYDYYAYLSADAGSSTLPTRVNAEYADDKLQNITTYETGVMSGNIFTEKLTLEKGSNKLKIFFLDSLNGMKPLTANIELN